MRFRINIRAARNTHKKKPISMRRQIEMKTNSPHSPHFARVSQMLTVFTLSSRARPRSLSFSLSHCFGALLVRRSCRMFDSLKICGWHSTLLVIDYDNVLKISSCVCLCGWLYCVCVCACKYIHVFRHKCICKAVYVCAMFMCLN